MARCPPRWNSASTPFGLGRASILAILAWVLLILSLIFGVHATSDCLSEEKREGTLGLLFLTPLRSFDILTGKLVSSAVNGHYCLAATAPPLFLLVLRGGISYDTLLRIAVVLINAIFLSSCCGLFVSSVSRDARKALFAAVGLVLLIVVGPLLAAHLGTRHFPGFFRSWEAWQSIRLASPVQAMLDSGAQGPGTYRAGPLLAIDSGFPCAQLGLVCDRRRGLAALGAPSARRETADPAEIVIRAPPAGTIREGARPSRGRARQESISLACGPESTKDLQRLDLYGKPCC